METESRYGQMGSSTLENSTLAKSMEQAGSSGLMATYTMAISWKITSREQDSICGLMAACTTVTGRTIRWRALELSLGLMAGGTWATTKMTRKTGMAHFSGQIFAYMKATGRMENNMEKASIPWAQDNRGGEEYGLTDKDKNGQNDICSFYTRFLCCI